MAHNRSIPIFDDAAKDIFNYAMPNAGVLVTTTLIGTLS
jgi:hypothetical protein